MATLLIQTYSPGPSKGILLNPSPAASPTYHPASLPALIPSNSSLSSSASSSAPGESSDYFSKSPSPGPSHGASSPGNSHLQPHNKPRNGSNPSTVRRIRFAPLPEPRRDDDMLPPVFLDDDADANPEQLTMQSALASAGVSLAAPADSDISKRAPNVPSDPTSSPAARRGSLPSDGLLLACPQVSPESSGSSDHAPREALPASVPSECGNDWDVLSSPTLPVLALTPPQSPRKAGKWSKVFKPLLGRNNANTKSPLARTFSSEELATMNGEGQQRGRSNSSNSMLRAAIASSRDSSVSRERTGGDFGAPLHRWTSEGGPGVGLPVSKKKRGLLFGSGGGSSNNCGNGVPLGRTQSLTSLSSKEEKKAAKTKSAPTPAVGGRKPTRMLNGRVYGARRNPNANPFANVRTDEPEFVEWGYGGMGSVKNTAGQSSVWSRVQADNNAAGLASKRNDDEDDGTGMAWVKRRKEERERQKREREKKEQEEREKAAAAAEANAENADVEMNTESEDAATDAKEDDAPTEKVGDEAAEVEPVEEDKENVPASANTTLPSTPAPSTPLASDAQRQPSHLEHITQAVKIPAPHHRHHHSHSLSHSHSHSHSHAHHHHGHSHSVSHIEPRGSGEAAHPFVYPDTEAEPSAKLPESEEIVERGSVSSSGASAMSTTSDDAEDEDSPKDTDGGYGNDEDEDSEEEEEDERSRLTALSAGVEKISRHHKDDQVQSASAVGTPAEPSS